MKKWRQYLLGHRFTILTDHHKLKELLTQVIQTPEQQMYLAHLMGYDYCIKYHSDSSNTVTDALSRAPQSLPATLLVLSVPCTFLDELKKHLFCEPQFIQLRCDIQAHPDDYSNYTITQELIMKRGAYMVASGVSFHPHSASGISFHSFRRAHGCC